jgi:hypothetical protein
MARKQVRVSSDQSADLYADRRYDRKLKHGADLSHCLDSPAVAEASRHIRRVVVVDNGSSDDSLDRLSAGLPIVGNLGFARACNRGGAAGAAPFSCCFSIPIYGGRRRRA